MTTTRDTLLVGVGGAAGASARYWLARAAPVATGTFPTTTLVINVTGALALGLLLGYLGGRRPTDTRLRPLLGIGFLGGFTTFSTFAVETVQLVRAHDAGSALLYVLASVTAGLVAARLGASLLRVPLPPEREP